MGEKKNGKAFLNFIGENFNTIITVFFALQLGNFVSAYYFYKASWIATLVFFLLVMLTFLVFKDVASEKHRKWGLLLAKISVVLFACSMINVTLLAMGSHLSQAKMKQLFGLGYFMNIAVLIGSFAWYHNKDHQEQLQTILEGSLLSKFNISTGTQGQKKSGDIQLATDIKTKAPVMLTYKDRFLHMLILGPTGSGKTSQIIIPMINQDMQNFDCGITVIEPKADLAEKVYAMAQHYGRKAMYFNPIMPDCPYFNPLFGREEDVIENMATTFKMLNPDSPQFFLDMNENLIRQSLKVLKRLYGNKTTLIDLARLIQNSGGVGRKMVTQFSRLNAETEAIAKENSDIASWFLNDYFNEKSKTYEHCSGVRSQVAKITSNRYLRKVLNPPNGENDIDFDKHLEEGGVIAIATAQGTLRDLGRFLGYFIILQLQSAVFRRPGNENTRRAHFLYIDEFQVYSNPGFADMLTQGRSYKVASHLATQNRALMAMGGGRDGKNFVELVSTNARNIVIFPGGNAVDAKYYSDQFGEIMKKQIQKGISKSKFNPLYGIQKMNYPNESIRESEALEARFTPTDLMYRQFGEITFCIVKNNTVQTPGIGKISYIPQDLNAKLDAMIEEYNRQALAKIEDMENTHENSHADSEISNTEPAIKEAPVIVPIIKPKEPIKPEREYVDPSEDYMEDIVLQAEKKPPIVNTDTPSAPAPILEGQDIEFGLEDEDDLI